MKATVWSKYNCTFCDQAKSLLKQKGYIIEERKIGDGYTKEELLEEIPQARTVPQIIINGNYIGGFEQLKAYIEQTTNNYGDGRL